MAYVEKHYPNLTWAQFAMCNDDATGAFEDMARRLFSLEFLGDGIVPHSDHNNPGVEVLPIQEIPHSDGVKPRKISFQAKYFVGKVSYSKIKESMNQAIKYYGDELDLIYLFCNKTLTTTTKGYKDTKVLLEKAGIELYPISNKEVLDLVSKYKDIANYFFLPRRRLDDVQFNQIHAGIIVDTKDDKDCTSCPIRTNDQIIDPRLLQNLVQEKIQACKEFILEMQLDKLRVELDKIFTYKLTGIEGVETLLFYRRIADLHDGKEIDIYADGLTEQYKNELLWLEQYYKNPVPVGAYTYASHCVESQIIVLDKMFASQLWDAVATLCKEIMDDASLEIADIVKQYYGLALFNLQKYSMATDLFRGLYQKSRKENILLYSVFAEIKSINLVWRDGHYEYRDRLVELMGLLDSLKDNKQYKSNKKLVAILYLETAYNLGVNEKKYLENVVDRYQGFSEEVKKDSVVKYLYALCLELNGSIEVAESIYAELDWTEDANIACRYLICKLSRNEYAEAVELYGKINQSVINAKLKSLYLTALFYEDKDRYEETLKEFLVYVQNDFEEVIDIAFGIHEKRYLQEYIVPLIRKYLDIELENLALIQKMELLSILSQAEEIELILTVIKSITEISTLNRFIIKEIYSATFAVSNREFVNHDKVLVKSNKLEAAGKIADIFLESAVSRREFLQIKYLCAGATEKKISMLKYAQEIFEITKEEGMARNIVAMLVERNETDFNTYVPYIEALSNSTIPDYCMVVAFAMLRLGKYEEADLYAYKALYYLNDTEDYEIYKSYFGYYNQSLDRYHDEEEIRRVKGNAVVTLEESSPVDGQEPKIITLCLDSESEFSDLSNTSMGIKHVPAGSFLYLKIQGSGMNQILKVDDVNYRIIDIHSRNDYVAKFIFKKISAHPEKFEGAVFVLASEKPEELVEKIKSITDRRKQTKALLDFYHFKENETGLPIDSFIGGDYDRYIDVLIMLLHSKDQALYTGLPIYENEENQKYIPALSTLVLLSSMNILNVLDGIKNSLLLPTSYMDFFSERYSKAKEISLVSQGKLVNVNNQLTLIKNDFSHIEIWERIIDFCTKCKKIEISDKERIGFSIGDDINGEQFISATQLHWIHLDAFVLAKKEQATLLCDDLFFRKMATYEKIRNINFVSLLQHYVDEDFVVPIIMELSKTNYLYIPFMARTDEEAIELKKNILDGKLKKKFYTSMLMAYNVAWKNIVREIFGEDIEFNEIE
mgnify:FL=1